MRPVATVVTAVLQDSVAVAIQYPLVRRQQNIGYKHEVAAWDDPPSDSDDNDHDDDEDDDASTIKMVQRLMRSASVTTLLFGAIIVVYLHKQLRIILGMLLMFML